jgi:hypothetical protein
MLLVFNNLHFFQSDRVHDEVDLVHAHLHPGSGHRRRPDGQQVKRILHKGVQSYF